MLFRRCGPLTSLHYLLSSWPGLDEVGVRTLNQLAAGLASGLDPQKCNDIVAAGRPFVEQIKAVTAPTGDQLNPGPFVVPAFNELLFSQNNLTQFNLVKLRQLAVHAVTTVVLRQLLHRSADALLGHVGAVQMVIFNMIRPIPSSDSQKGYYMAQDPRRIFETRYPYAKQQGFRNGLIAFATAMKGPTADVKSAVEKLKTVVVPPAMLKKLLSQCFSSLIQGLPNVANIQKFVAASRFPKVPAST